MGEEGEGEDDVKDGEEEGEAGIAVDIAVDDEASGKISKNDLDLESIGEGLIRIICGNKVTSSDPNCPQFGEELEIGL